MHQLSFLRTQVVERANAVGGDPPLVTDVRFHMGGRRSIAAEDMLAPLVAIRRQPARERALPPPALGERLAAIERDAARVVDPELREIILDVRRRLSL
jgi:hypothetical protein